MLRLRREGHINGQEVPEIILLNSHDGSSSYQMIPGIFRFVCTNGLVCGNNFGEIRVPHKGDIVGQVIEGAYEVLGVFDKVTDNMEAMKEIHLNSDEQHLFGRAALMVRYEDENKTPVTPEQIILCPRKMVWQEAAQLPGIYKMGSRFAGLRPVSIVTHLLISGSDFFVAGSRIPLLLFIPV